MSARAGDEEGLRAALASSEAGAQWLADYEATKDPWFYFSYGTGVFYHHHRSWIDDPTLPIATIGSYVERLEAGEDIARPIRGDPCGARADHGGVPLLARRRGAAGIRREPGARANRLPLRREPQLLHRPPVHDDLLEQGARVRCAPCTARIPDRQRGRLLPAPRRGALGARGAQALLELRAAPERRGAQGTGLRS